MFHADTPLRRYFDRCISVSPHPRVTVSFIRPLARSLSRVYYLDTSILRYLLTTPTPPYPHTPLAPSLHSEFYVPMAEKNNPYQHRPKWREKSYRIPAPKGIQDTNQKFSMPAWRDRHRSPQGRGNYFCGSEEQTISLPC